MSLGVQFPSDQQAYNSAIGSISYAGKNVNITGKIIFAQKENEKMKALHTDINRGILSLQNHGKGYINE